MKHTSTRSVVVLLQISH